MEACRGGDPLIPNYLLDNEADPKEGGLGPTGPLFAAVELGQPLELIAKMIRAVARVGPMLMTVAILRRISARSLLVRTAGGGAQGCP